jgi:hypothetical protein
MNFVKPDTKKDPLDDVQRLMCSVPGCPKRWSVHMEGQRPMCSEHQWSDRRPATKRDIAALLPNTKPVKHWMDDGEVF